MLELTSIIVSSIFYLYLLCFLIETQYQVPFDNNFFSFKISSFFFSSYNKKVLIYEILMSLPFLIVLISSIHVGILSSMWWITLLCLTFGCGFTNILCATGKCFQKILFELPSTIYTRQSYIYSLFHGYSFFTLFFYFFWKHFFLETLFFWKHTQQHH